MFNRDATAIAAHAIASPSGLMDVIEFTLCTIRQPLQQMIAQRKAIARDGAKSPHLFGSKREGWTYAQANINYLHRVALDILKREDSAERKADLIQHFMQIHGLGVVKASFVVQMLGGGTSCLDTHNLKALGLPDSAVKISPKLKPETIRAKVLAYVTLCESAGNSEYWWDSWCQFVAGRRGSPLKTADEVSAYHLDAVLMAA